jgi:hypothetical protein
LLIELLFDCDFTQNRTQNHTQKAYFQAENPQKMHQNCAFLDEKSKNFGFWEFFWKDHTLPYGDFSFWNPRLTRVFG